MWELLSEKNTKRERKKGTSDKKEGRKKRDKWREKEREIKREGEKKLWDKRLRVRVKGDRFKERER